MKQTVLYDRHVAAGAAMVDFGGWNMPMNYPTGIVDEHLYTRKYAGLFDVSHMGRFLVEGPDRVRFLQHVLTSNVNALDLNQAQYTIIPNQSGGAVDDAYLYRFFEDRFILVVNASNTAKDWEHLTKQAAGFDVQLTDWTQKLALLALQGPESKNMLMELTGAKFITEPMKNALNTLSFEGTPLYVSKTGYTGEPIGYELFIDAASAVSLWDKLVCLGAKPAGLGARDTLRLEAALPLYGHEMGTGRDGTELPVFAVPLARFAVSFNPDKGDFIGRKALEEQFNAVQRIMNRDFSDLSVLPQRIRPIALTGKGVCRGGFDVYKDGKPIGYVTSGTMVPYLKSEGQGLESVITGEKLLRPIGLALLSSDVLKDDPVEVDVRGKRIPAVVPAYHMRGDAPPYARPIVVGMEAPQQTAPQEGDYATRAASLIGKALDNHAWRQDECINLIPSEMTQSRAVRLLLASDPSFRYAEHKKIKSFYDHDVFYYQGTGFIDEVERLTVEEMKKYLGCAQVETRVISGQMSNMAVFSALMDFKNRLNRKRTPQRLGYVLNNHIIKGGHLSAQPMGALHDYIAVDPVTERSAVVNFPVCADNVYKIDVEAAKKVIDKYRPELIIFGKSMVLHKEPVAAIRRFVDEQAIPTTIMYDMAHVLGLVGDYFQKPFQEGAEIVTGSTHKTFYGPQRGVIGVNFHKGDLKYDLWETIQSRAFPGSVSNHHLGTLLGLLMAVYEMNAFKDDYQKNVIHNAKHFAAALKANGLEVAGDPAISYTETHQVILKVGYGEGPEIANRMEKNNVVVNYQATPEEEGFTASGALRMGVSEMTRFGFGDREFDRLAELMADAILRGADIREDIKALRAGFRELKYCFSDQQMNAALDKFALRTGLAK